MMSAEKELDELDWKILRLLGKNGRLPFAEIGRRVNLSVPAVAARVRRMEEAEIIAGYHAKINLPKVGLPVLIFVQVWVPVEKYPSFKELINGMDGVVEWHHVTGDASFVLKIALPSVSHLEAVIVEFSQYGQTASLVVMSSGEGIVNTLPSVQ